MASRAQASVLIVAAVSFACLVGTSQSKNGLSTASSVEPNTTTTSSSTARSASQLNGVGVSPFLEHKETMAARRLDATTEAWSFIDAFGEIYGDHGHSVVELNDSSLVMIGYVFVNFGVQGALSLQVDAKGALRWAQATSGVDSDVSISGAKLADGGLVIASSRYVSSYDMFAMKLSADGAVRWAQQVGGGGHDFAYTTIGLDDGGLAVAGYTKSFGSSDYEWLVTTFSSEGPLRWAQVLEGCSSGEPRSMTELVDGGLAVAGYTDDFGAGSNDALAILLDTEGRLQWAQVLGGSGDDRAQSSFGLADGGIVVAGYTGSFGAGNSDALVMKFCSNGRLLWAQALGGDSWDNAKSIVELGDGGLAFAGSTSTFGAGSQDALVVKLSHDGRLLWARTVGGTSSDYANSIVELADGGLAVAGSTENIGAGDYDAMITRLDANGWGDNCSGVVDIANITDLIVITIRILLQWRILLLLLVLSM